MKKIEKPEKPLFLKSIKGNESIIEKHLKSIIDEFQIKIKITPSNMGWFSLAEMDILRRIVRFRKPEMKVNSARETKDGYYTITISYKT